MDFSYNLFPAYLDRQFPDDIFAGYIEEIQEASLQNVTPALFLLDKMNFMTEQQLRAFFVVVRGRADLTAGTPEGRGWRYVSKVISEYLLREGIDPSEV